MHDSDKREPQTADTPPHEAPSEPAGEDDRVIRPGVWSPPRGAGADAGETGPAAGDAAAPVSEGEGDDPVQRISELEAEKSDLTDRLLRTAAEMDNLRKRTQRDLEDARRYAVSRFAGDMLAVVDNLQRALGSVSEAGMAGADEATKSIIDGVDMTAREFERVLEKHGVKRIAAKGERFDPHRHQAMFEVAQPDVPAGTVIEEVQPGYMIGERVLRAAMVGVARGGPKPGNGGETADKPEAAPDEPSAESSKQEDPQSGGETSPDAA